MVRAELIVAPGLTDADEVVEGIRRVTMKERTGMIA